MCGDAWIEGVVEIVCGVGYSFYDSCLRGVRSGVCYVQDKEKGRACLPGLFEMF